MGTFALGEAATTGTGAVGVYAVTSVRVNGGWYAYGILAEDGGISWNTYETPEKAKRDPLYRGRAKIIRLHIENWGVEEERRPTQAEMRMQEMRAYWS